MKKFKTLIITKKKLQRFGICICILSVFAATGVIVSKTAEPRAVPVFSVSGTSNDGTYSEILEDALPDSSEPKSIKSIINDILGFDAEDPESIIKSSSSVFDSAATAAPVSETAEPPQNTDAPPATAAPDSLPSPAEISAHTGVSLNNATNYSVDTDELCKESLSFTLERTEPEVLIVHTHTTECYDGDAMPGETDRTTNAQYNMNRVGDIIAQTLESYGIKTIHDTTIHDYPSYQGAYTSALETINKNVAAYPSIKVVLDVHRDAYVYEDGSKLRVAETINGEETAQVMLVVGTDSMGLYHPHWRENLKLAVKTQSAAEIMYPGLMRSVNLRRERFNMHVTKGSLLLEVGSNGNSLAEAERAAKYVATALAAALQSE